MEGVANVGPSNQTGMAVPDFLPPAQRVLFMRLQQKQQEDEERARRLADGGGTERENEGGNTPHVHVLELFNKTLCSVETAGLAFKH